MLWANGGSSYKDVEAATEENWKSAFDYLASKGFVDLVAIEASAER